MPENRARRVAEQIKKEVSLIIAEDLKDPRITSLTTVTAVQVSRDLRYAWIYISIYGNENEKEQTFQAIIRAAGFIRSEIGRRIRLRFTPELIFHHDRSLEYGAHIEQVLKSISGQREEDEEQH